VHTQINVSTPEEVLFFWYSSSSPKAEKMRAADGRKVPREKCAQLMEARW
jgi:hypothetical protein